MKLSYLVFGLAALSAGTAQAQTSALPNFSVTQPGAPGLGGQIITPDSGIAQPPVNGVRTNRTHYKIFVPTPAETQGQAQPFAVTPAVNGPPYSGYYYETPASLACIYQLVAQTPGCDPNVVSTNATGGSSTKPIFIVDAYHNATALADLQTYSTQFGLPSPNLQVVFARGSQPAANAGWAGEIALDLDIAHAMAPNAKIVLVEAASNSDTELLFAEDVASGLAVAAGGGVVSNSWGRSEDSSITSYESHFTGKANVVFFASTGDSPGIQWPSSSPNIVAVGGTSTSRATTVPANRGKFRTEVGWGDAGSGFSAYFPAQSYQAGLGSRLGGINSRFVPDVSFDANPATGVWVYCTASTCGQTGGNWLIFGGTSVASPAIAAMVNNAGAFRASSQVQLTFMYSQLGASNYFDISLGVCGPYAGFYTSSAAASGSSPPWQWDLCTGIGAPRGLSGL